MKINIPFFYKRLPVIVERDSLYLGQVYNNDTRMTARKILCTSWFSDYAEDVLFDSPKYRIEGQTGYTVDQMVSLGRFLKKLGYPERLNTKDIRKIYNQVLSSTKTLHGSCKLFGIVRVSGRYKGKNTYWPYHHRKQIMAHEDFYKLEYLISLPLKPSASEKQNEDYSFQKRLFFIS